MSENLEINDAIERVFTETLGGRAVKREVVDRLADNAPEHLSEYVIRHGWNSLVGSYFRQKAKCGLAQAPEVDSAGTHVQLELLAEDDYRYIIARHVKSGKNALRIAKEYRRLAQERLHVDISLTDPLEGAA